MFRVEVARAVRRPRTWILALAIAAVPVVLVVAIRASPRTGTSVVADGPPFVGQVTRNGLFAALAGLAIVQPVLLSIAAGLVTGDAIAGEARSGMLRALLVRPVGRTRLLLSKYAVGMLILAALVVVTLVAGLVAGAVGFGVGPLPTLPGTTLGLLEASARIAGTGCYMVVALSGLVSVGMFLTARSDAPAGATVATVTIAVTSQILDEIESLRAIHPFLPTHGWRGFTGLFRFPVDWAPMLEGARVSAAYTAVFLTLAIITFRRRDVLA